MLKSPFFYSAPIYNPYCQPHTAKTSAYDCTFISTTRLCFQQQGFCKKLIYAHHDDAALVAPQFHALAHNNNRYSLNKVFRRYDLPTRRKPVTIFISPLSFESISCCTYFCLSIFMDFNYLCLLRIVYIPNLWQYCHFFGLKKIQTFSKLAK